MKRIDVFWTFSLAAAIMVTGGCAVNDGMPADDRTFGTRLPAEFIDPDGERIGSAVLTETANGVLIDIEVRDIAPGWHGLHIHERGDCSADDFESAGAHYGPGERQHGFLASSGPHAGDLPNIFVGMDGTARVQAIATGVSLRSGNNALVDHDGSAIVIHSGADDYQSEPSGQSGERVACAEIR